MNQTISSTISSRFMPTVFFLSIYNFCKFEQVFIVLNLSLEAALFPYQYNMIPFKFVSI